MRSNVLLGITILVVEDHTDSRELATFALEQRQAQAIPADSADAAFALLKLHRPHVIISDISMPGEDGISLMRRIRRLADSEGGSTPAIALTALCATEDRARILDAGFHIHLTKPVEPDRLIAAVRMLARV